MNQSQAQRAFHVAQRLLEQSRRLGLVCPIKRLAMPLDAEGLYLLEGQIQATALTLARRSGLAATSLEVLIDLLERFGVERTIAGPWQA